MKSLRGEWAVKNTNSHNPAKKPTKERKKERKSYLSFKKKHRAAKLCIQHGKHLLPLVFLTLCCCQYVNHFTLKHLIVWKGFVLCNAESGKKNILDQFEFSLAPVYARFHEQNIRPAHELLSSSCVDRHLASFRSAVVNEIRRFILASDYLFVILEGDCIAQTLNNSMLSVFYRLIQKESSSQSTFQVT